MWGAVFGDFSGSIYEYEQLKKVSSISPDDLISKNAFFSDDTITTIAILDAILHDVSYEKKLKEYANAFSDYHPNFEPYFSSSFSPGFMKWVKGKGEGYSIGNGALMRVSPVGYLFDSLDEVQHQAYLATVCSHNSEEAILSSIKVASIIYLARLGFSKREIVDTLDLNFTYMPFHKFNTTCYETLDNCLYAVFTSNSFEESIRKVLSYGGRYRYECMYCWISF